MLCWKHCGCARTAAFPFLQLNINIGEHSPDSKEEVEVDMDLIARYRSDGSDGASNSSSESEELPITNVQLKTASAAPTVDTGGLTLVDSSVVAHSTQHQFQDATTRTVFFNPKHEDLAAPVVGPANPLDNGGIPSGMRNHRAGVVEDEHLSPFVFDEQYNTFHSYGYSVNPSGSGLIGDANAWESNQGESVFTGARGKKRKTTAEKKAANERKSARMGEEMDPDQPWELTTAQPWAQKEVEVCELTEEQQAYMDAINEEKAAAGIGKDAKEPKSFFHGKEDKDYAGRSWMTPPREKKKENDYCFLPKRLIHTWSGHTKGVNAIRFFPGTGHLMLSAGLDGRVKIWDVYGSGKCMRTYLGHSKGVRDVCFSNDGSRFLSTGYDSNVRLWDTETGKVLRTINNNRIFYVVKFHPDDDKQNVLMAGCSDKKVYQWDLDTGDLIQEYDYHLDAVNTITFVDEGRRFVTSSDDKTLRVWEFGIPVQIKYIADPSMHSIPSIALHPTGNYFSGQSQDNQIVTYSTKERFRLNRKKTFKGHTSAGYACQVNFSPDGRFVISGDSEGRCFFWEWQNPRRVVQTFKAHEGSVCIGCAWHPLETSKVATCGWDGLIKYWD